MFRDLALLAMAHGLLRVCRPLQAHAILQRVGRLFPELRTPEEARRMASTLAGHGTCLSRSLAVAARVPDAEVVIGVAPGGASPLFAHAWVEMDGVPLDPTQVAGSVIARLPARRA